MTKKAQDEARIAARLAETIKSIEDLKLGHEALVRMAATYAIGYFDLQKLIEKQEKTIETQDELHKLLPVIFEKFREQAEAIDAFSPLLGLDNEDRADLIRRNTAARRIDAGIKFKKSKDAKVNGARGGAKKNEPTNALSEFAIREYKKKKWPSRRQASKDKDFLLLVMEESRRLGANISDANKEDTVYKWLLNDNKKAKVHK